MKESPARNPILDIRDWLIDAYGVENVDVASFDKAAADYDAPAELAPHVPGDTQ